MAFVHAIREHLREHWGNWLIVALLAALFAAHGCADFRPLRSLTDALTPTPKAPAVAPDIARLHALGLVCFSLAVVSFIGRVWVPVIPLRVTAGLIAGGLGAYVVAWVLGKLVWIVAIAGVLLAGEIALRWHRRQKSGPS